MREEIVTEPVVVDADTTAAQEFVGGIIERSFTMDELIVDRWMGVGVSVRLIPEPTAEIGFSLLVGGHGGPNTPQEWRDVLQLAIDSLDATEGTRAEEEP